MTDRLELKAAFTVDDAGEITGTAWPFGSPDRVGDVIEKGAFTAPAILPMLFAHDQAQVIGVWNDIRETSDGLIVKGRLLVDQISRAAEVRAMIRERAVTGLSIGFVTKAAKPRQRGRTITALDLHEISVVAVPCHPDAQITSVKSTGDTTTHKETTMENALENAPESDPVIDQKAFDEMKARMDKMEAKMNRPVAANNNQPLAGNENDLDKKAFVSFLRRGVERLSLDEVKALTVSVDANGGYLAPEAFGNEILKKIVEMSPIRQYAKVTTITAPEVKYPRKLTGTAATWVSEIGNRTESGMTFEQATFTPYELSTFVPVSRQLLEDNAYGLEGELSADFGESFAKTEGAAFVSGDGTGKPKGLLTASGITEIKTGHASTLGTDPAATIIAMFHKLPSVVAQNGVWIMNRTTLGALRTLKDGTGRFIMLDPITRGAPATLLGRPIVEAIDMPDVAANAFPIMFGDLSGYRIVDRIGLSVLRDPFTLSDTGQVKFTAYRRVGADVSHPDRFIKLKVAA
jgi:HK97 family phage major capsid protein/HK97 family phage prohead protease